MYKAQIDVAAETREALVVALEEAAAQIKGGAVSGADLLGDGWTEYDFLVQDSALPLQTPINRQVNT